MFSFFKKKKEEVKKNPAIKAGIIQSIFSQKKLSQQSLEELENILISSDIGVSASDRIINNFAIQRQNKNASEEQIKQALADDIEKILNPCEQTLIIDTLKKPYIIMMIGVNGAGKTTSIGKMAHKFAQQDFKISLIAGDTFRAAAVDQLKIWGTRNNIRVFSGENGCNPAGLVYDGINQAIKENDDIVFIDTAGRLQNKTHLMEELKKIDSVIKKIVPAAPHSTILTLDATTGQNALEQVKVFKEMINISGIIITKLDGTSKGGVLIAIAQETKTPINFIGVGEKIEDLKTFDAKDFAKNIVGL